MSIADSAPHQVLARMEGSWEGQVRTWFEPTSTPLESAARGTCRLLLGGRFLCHEYEWSDEGRPQQGLQLVGFHRDRERYTASWVDSFHTGTEIMHFLGDRPGEVSLLSSYGELGAEWGWRTTLALESDALVVGHYNQPPDGSEYLAVEFRYTRLTT